MIRMLLKLLLATGFSILAASRGIAQVGPPPVITVQPLALSVQLGDTAVFSVHAVSATSLSYQWYRDGKKLKDGTGATLTLEKVASGDAGEYVVDVKNASGVATSSSATLVILKKEKKQLHIKGASMTSEGLNLTVVASDTSITNCVLYACSDLTNWTPITTNSLTSGEAVCTDSAVSQHNVRFYKAMDQ